VYYIVYIYTRVNPSSPKTTPSPPNHLKRIQTYYNYYICPLFLQGPLELARIFLEAGLPAGVFNVVCGLGPVAGRALAEDPRIAKLDLTVLFMLNRACES